MTIYFRLALSLLVLAGGLMPQSLLLAQEEANMEKGMAESGIKAKNAGSSFLAGDDNVEMKSLLLSDNDIVAIRSARNYYEQHLKGNNVIAEDDFLKNLEKISNIQEEPRSFTYPQFFLSSIAYRSARDWVVWINDEKITQDSGVSAAGLRIVQIDNEKITVEWKPQRMDKITDASYSSDESIKVDFMHKKVIFPLKANQTFTSYSMRVVEGKLPPVTVGMDEGSGMGMLEKN
ncbi:MAG: hypothetical protein AABY33_03715 [Pseudomonadota bacterium]